MSLFSEAPLHPLSFIGKSREWQRNMKASFDELTFPLISVLHREIVAQWKDRVPLPPSDIKNNMLQALSPAFLMLLPGHVTDSNLLQAKMCLPRILILKS